MNCILDPGRYWRFRVNFFDLVDVREPETHSLAHHSRRACLSVHPGCVLLINVPFIQYLLSLLAQGAGLLQDATLEGTKFVFGYIGGGALPFEETGPGSSFIFGLQSLPVVLMVGALSALLWHWRILVVIVKGAAFFVTKTFNVSGAVGISAAANIFMGMVEAPLLVKPYIPKLTRSELFVVMVGGLSTIAGSTMVLLGTILETCHS